MPPDRADDVVQETLLTIHRARATYDPRRSFDAWLRVIVERRSVDVLRQAYRHGAREVHAPLAYEGHAEGGVNLTAGIDATKMPDGFRLRLPNCRNASVKPCAISCWRNNRSTMPRH